MRKGIEGKLISKQINPTANRILVLDFMLNQLSAIRLTDIEKGLAPADRITIYRTLKKFEAHGLIHSIDDGTVAPKYAMCVEDCDIIGHHDLHVHFRCNICKETICLPDTTLPSISLPKGFQSEEMNLIITGICENCT